MYGHILKLRKEDQIIQNLPKDYQNKCQYLLYWEAFMK